MLLIKLNAHLISVKHGITYVSNGIIYVFLTGDIHEKPFLLFQNSN